MGEAVKTTFAVEDVVPAVEFLLGTSDPDFAHELHARQSLEVCVAGQEVGPMLQGRCVDMASAVASLSVAQSSAADSAILVSRGTTRQVWVNASTGSAVSLPASRFSHLASSSWTIVGRSQSSRAGIAAATDSLVGDPISHSTRPTYRPGASEPVAAIAVVPGPRAFGDAGEVFSTFGTGTSLTPVPFGMNAKACPASHRRAARTEWGSRSETSRTGSSYRTRSYPHSIDGVMVRVAPIRPLREPSTSRCASDRRHSRRRRNPRHPHLPPRTRRSPG